MANTDHIITMVAAETLTAYDVVALDANGKAALPSGGDDDGILGVAQRGASAGEVVEIIVAGITRAKAGAGITFATTPLLMAATDGELVAATSTNYPVARVLPNINQTSTAAAGEEFFVYFFGPSVVLA